MRTTAALSCVVLATSGMAARAQTFVQQAIYSGLMRTSVAGLPPLVTSTILNEVQSNVAVAVRYGYLQNGAGLGNLNNFAATAVVPLGIGNTLSAGIGFSSESYLGEIRRTVMVSVGGDARLMALPITRGTDGTRILLGVTGEGGYGHTSLEPASARSWSAELGAPISIVQANQSRDAWRLVPFVTPSFAFSNYGCSHCIVDVAPGSRGPNRAEGGVLFLFGGGVGVYNRAYPVAFNIGFHYVGIPNGQTLVGLGVTLGGR